MSGSGVRLISILEGGEGEPERPVSLSVVDEHPKIVLDFLVNPFCLSVCLWVMRGAGGSFDMELFVQIFNERGHEDGSAVRDDLPGNTVHTDYVLDEQIGPAFRV